MNRLENTNVKNMRGLFQNCEAIVSLDLTNFFTPNVEIMWDMFNGCNRFIYS
jgi:surface protein